MNKVITVIGLGNVGQTIVQNLLMVRAYSFCINIMDPADVSGSIHDLEHAATVYKDHTIVFNDQKLFNRSDFIFHTAGPSFSWEAGRLSVTDQSVELTYDIFSHFRPEKEPYIIVISNPVDVISYHTFRASGLPENKILGTGTYLDTVRFESKLAKAFDLDPTLIKALILGEHGHSQVYIGQQISIDNAHPKTPADQAKIQQVAAETIEAAHQIIKTQGATKFGVSMCAIRLMLSIINDDPITIPVSVQLNVDNRQLLKVAAIFLSVPCTINAAGIHQLSVEKLRPDELNALRLSARTIEQHTFKPVPQKGPIS